MIARADVDVVRRQRHVQLTGHSLGFRDLLGLEPFALEHVQKVGVATEVELAAAA